MVDRKELRQWIIQYLANLLHMDEEDVNLDQGLLDLGLDSADSILMSGEMEERFGLELEPSIFLETRTVQELIDRISEPSQSGTVA
jgi:acyl carrier protein